MQVYNLTGNLPRVRRTTIGHQQGITKQEKIISDLLLIIEKGYSQMLLHTSPVCNSQNAIKNYWSVSHRPGTEKQKYLYGLCKSVQSLISK